MRHDHDPKTVGDPRGVCRTCEDALIPDGSRQRGDFDCACAQCLEEMEERMRRTVFVEQQAARDGVMVDEAKAQAESGRS